MGQAPETNEVSLRTFNRNFEGRSGTKSASVYLVSPETAAVSAIYGKITDPSILDMDIFKDIEDMKYVNDSMIIAPEAKEDAVVIKGPNIKPFPVNDKMPQCVTKSVVLKVGDNISTDDIMPSNAKLLPYRSNIPYLSQYCFSSIDSSFSNRCTEKGGGFIIAGENYGQGSSREHAALVPLYLGIKGVIAKSFARIHKSNLINSGIIPLTFRNPYDYNDIELSDILEIQDLPGQIESGNSIVASIKNKDKTIELCLGVTEREKEILKAGGYINYMKDNGDKGTL